MSRFLYILIILITLGCNSDKVKEDVQPVLLENLTGNWNIYYATRNGKETKSLESGNFTFLADNTVKSNLFTAENSYNFTLDQNIISIDTDEMINKIKVASLSNDTLVLESKMKIYDIGFYLVRDSLQ